MKQTEKRERYHAIKKKCHRLVNRISDALDLFDFRFQSFMNQHQERICFTIRVLSILAIGSLFIWILLDPLDQHIFTSSSESLNESWQLIIRIVLTVSSFLLYFLIGRKIWMKDPIHRDRSLFSKHGWGMAFYSVQAILMIIALICTIAYIWRIEDIYVDKPGAGSPMIIWDVISQFADPGNIHNSNGSGGRLIALVSALLGIFCLSGLAVSSLVSIIDRSSKHWRQGLVRYKKGFTNYVVVIGNNEQAAAIVKKSLKSGADYILLQTRKNVEQERAKLELKLDRDDEEKIVFYYGERTSSEDIADLRLEKAREVYILGEDMHSENEEDHDSFNMTCLELISQYCASIEKLRKKNWVGEKLKCHVDFEYQSTYTIFKSTHIYKRLNENLEFIPFNIHEIWAKKVLIDNYAIIPGARADESKVQRYLPIDCYKINSDEYKGIGINSDKSVHLFVVGMNQMGVALAMQVALYLHLPNFYTKGLRTTISFVDEHAVKEGEFLQGRYAALFDLCRHRSIVCGKDEFDREWDNDDPMKKADSKYHHLGENFMDIQWEFIEGNVASDDIRDYMGKVADDPRKTCTIAVCFNNPQQSIATALYLPEKVLKRVLQVLVYQQDNFDLIKKVATGENEWKRYDKLKPFGMLEDCYKGDVFDNTMAKLALTVYKRCTLHCSHIDALIEYSNRMWSQEGIVNKLANINLVDSFNSKNRSAFSSSMEESESLIKECLIKAEHCRWMIEKLTVGYRPLYRDEMASFVHPMDIVEETDQCEEIIKRKNQKEYLKSKNRAHLDICSYDMLKDVDPAVLGNDERIIDNLLKLNFYKVERKILCRLPIIKRDEISNNDERQSITSFVLDEMKEIPKGKQNVFWMGKTPVTQGLWKLIMGKNNNPSKQKKDDSPVTNVSKQDVDDFITILNDKTGLHFCLPGIEDWKYAALGGLSEAKVKKESRIGGKGDYNREKSCLISVGKNANGYGLFSMFGNIWEWTQTKCNECEGTYYFCGGSYKNKVKERDLSYRNESWCSQWVPEFKSEDLGFRLVLPYRFKKDTSVGQNQWDEKKKMFEEIVKLKKEDRNLSWNQKRVYIVEVKGGSFVMNKHGHPVQVELSSFYISSAPVTQRQWMAFMEDKNPSSHKGDDLPVENVSYKDAMIFIERLNAYNISQSPLRLGGKRVRFDLPTEAQWEFAARGGIISKGYKFAGGNEADVVAWHYGITKQTHRVGSKIPNELGLYDMSGNVWEWCKDWYQSDYYEDQDILKDPQGPETGNARVFKGGSWRFTENECEVSYTSYWMEDYVSDDLGFRIVLNIISDESE